MVGRAQILDVWSTYSMRCWFSLLLFFLLEHKGIHYLGFIMRGKQPINCIDPKWRQQKILEYSAEAPKARIWSVQQPSYSFDQGRKTKHIFWWTRFIIN